MYSPVGQQMDGRVGSQPLSGRLFLNSLRVGKILANHIEVAVNLNIIFIQFVKKKITCVFLIYKILYIDAEAKNVAPNVA